MECPKCGYVMQPFEETCPRCARLGPPQQPAATPPADPTAAPPDSQTQAHPYAAAPAPVYAEYAGFWLRFVACFIDDVIVMVGGMILGCVVGLMIGLSLSPSGSDQNITQATTQVIGNIIGIILSWLYFTLMESSSKQATLGKMALRITVTDMNGDRISWGRANARHWSKIISAVILCIGYIMAGFTENKQALHDMIAGTLVVRG